jgi:hypothetical protein
MMTPVIIKSLASFVIFLHPMRLTRFIIKPLSGLDVSWSEDGAQKEG